MPMSCCSPFPPRHDRFGAWPSRGDHRRSACDSWFMASAAPESRDDTGAEEAKAAGRLMRPIPFDALEAFVQEHQRCDVLDGGVDNGFVWFQCTCGGLIMHPATEPPKTAPHTT